MNSEIIDKIITFEDKIVKMNYLKKNKHELFNVIKTKINQYLDNPNSLYNKNYLNLFNYNDNIDLNEYYNLMYSNFNNIKKNYELVIVLNLGSIVNLNLLFSKISIFKNSLYGNKILLVLTITEEIYLHVLKLNLFDIFESNIAILRVKNKGCDIGSYYLSLDYLIKENINYEYILKLHSKSDTNWLNNMTAYLKNKKTFDNVFKDIKEKNILIYGMNKIFMDYRNLLCTEHILNNYSNGLYEELFTNHRLSFIAGTIFIIKKELMDFILELVPLKNYIYFEELYSSNHSIYDQSIIHCLERLFSISEVIYKLNISSKKHS